MQNSRRVSMELHYDIQQFLYREARMLDEQRFREWADTVLDPNIRYQMVIMDERYLRDQVPEENREIMVYDDDLRALDLRVRQFDTGLQRMMDPPQHLLRLIANVEAYHESEDDTFRVFSYGNAYRFRREYEHEQVVYRRTDKIRKDRGNEFRIVTRRVDLSERVVRNKNLLFFL